MWERIIGEWTVRGLMGKNSLKKDVSRRAVLSAVGGSVFVGTASAGTSENNEDSTVDGTSPPEFHVLDDISNIINPDEREIVYSGNKYLFVDVGTQLSGVTVDEIDLVQGETSYSAIEKFRIIDSSKQWSQMYQFDTRTEKLVSRGQVLFEIPSIDPSADAEIRFGENRLSIPSDVVTSLHEDIPEFEIVSRTIPNSVSAGEKLAVEFDVKNMSDRSGVFRLASNVTGIVEESQLAFEKILPGDVETVSTSFLMPEFDQEDRTGKLEVASRYKQEATEVIIE